MSATLLRVTLRGLAVIIAVAAAIDPAWSTMRVLPKRLVAIGMTSSNVTPHLAALRSVFPGWEVVSRELSGTRVPCDPTEACVLIADGSIYGDLPADHRGPVAVLDVRDTRAVGVSIRGITVYDTQQSASGVIHVELERRAVAEPATLVTLQDEAAIVGSAKAVWGSENRTSVDVPWWPLAPGGRVLRVEAQPAAGETELADNRIDVGVNVRAQRSPVLVMDATPSWSSTFVRRALDRDARFTVEHRAALAPGLSAGTSLARLDPRTLEHMPLVIVGGPDALSAEEVNLLDRFVTVRGGSLLLLPERAPTGPASRLFHGVWSEKLLPQPERVGALRASEFLTATDLDQTASVMARAGDVPSIVDAPSGDGRIVVAGAMDAWRYRDQDDGAFDRFWQSLAQQLAVKGAPLRVTFGDPLAASSSRMPFTIRLQSFAPEPSIEAAAVMRCNDERPQAIRLWPNGPMGEFRGELPAAGPASCTLEGTIGGQPFDAAIAVIDRPQRGVGVTMEKLVREMSVHHGTVVASGDDAALARSMTVSDSSTPAVVRPMRAWWWLLPFAGCLSMEWWLRRRLGLR